MKKWLQKPKKALALATGILLLFLCLVINPFSLNSSSNLVLSVAVLMISWWVLDALPLPVVALVPLVLFPLLNISNIKTVAVSYSDPNIYLFMGGFLIGIGIEKWNLHKRIALNIIKRTGTNGNRIILGFIISTGFLSLWLSNTATTMMMFPVALSVIQVIGAHHEQGRQLRHFSVALMLSIAYASNLALGTIIGTPPNVAYVNYISDRLGYTIGFTDWMIIFIPLTIVLMLLLYLVLVKWLYPNHIRHSDSGHRFISDELEKLGKWSKAEKRLAAVFSITVFLWIGKDLINMIQHSFILDDTIIAMIGGLSLFIIPSGENDTARLLEWEDTRKMAWGILLLFGGGIALAKALEDAGLMQEFGNFLASYSTGNGLLMIFVVTTASIFLSELMSNVAQVIVMAPVITSLAISLKMDPLLLGIPMTLGASCAGMLPMGTPPNAIVFGSGHIKMKEMLKAGFVMNLICAIVITLFCYYLQPILMKV